MFDMNNIHQTEEIKTQNRAFATFDLTMAQKNRFLSSTFIANLLATDRWDLCDRSFKDYNMKEIFKRMGECKALIILMDYNKLPNIIKFIQKPYYSQLQQIFLGDNAITSIESLNRVHMPNLLILHLNDNHISQFFSFRKCLLPKLNTLSIKQNKIPHQFHLLLSLICFNGPNLQNIFVDYSRNMNLLERKDIGMIIGTMSKSNWKIRCQNNKNGLKKQVGIRQIANKDEIKQ